MKMNQPDSINRMYVENDTLSVRMNLHKKYSVNRYGWHNWVFDQFSIKENMKILELGCGTGDIWVNRENRIPENVKIILTDISPLMSGKAKENLEKNENFSFELADIRKIPFGDNEFDAVIANHILYHVPNPEEALSEIYRVLKADGVLYSTTIGENSLRELTEIYLKYQDRVNFSYSGNLSFSLDKGEDILKNYFHQIEKKLYLDSLEVTDAGDLMDYIVSYNDVPEDIQDKIRETINDEIQKNGSFKIIKEQGMFICSK